MKRAKKIHAHIAFWKVLTAAHPHTQFYTLLSNIHVKYKAVHFLGSSWPGKIQSCAFIQGARGHIKYKNVDSYRELVGMSNTRLCIPTGTREHVKYKAVHSYGELVRMSKAVV